MSLSWCPWWLLRALTISRFTFSALALLISAVLWSCLLLSAYTLFYSLVRNLVLVSSLYFLRLLSAASRLSPCSLSFSNSLPICCWRLPSASVILLSRSNYWFCLVRRMMKFVSSAFTFSAFAFSTTFYISASWRRAAWVNLSWRLRRFFSTISLHLSRANYCRYRTLLHHSRLLLSIFNRRCSALC